MPDKLFQNYFSQIANPEYRRAQQQQNLFSNLLQYGAQMRAAGAPTTNVGQPALLASQALSTLGQNMNKGNQAYQNQLINAIKLKSLMTKNQIAQNQMAARKNLANKFTPGSKEEAAILANIPLSSVGVLTGRPAAKIQELQFLQALEKQYPPTKDAKTGEWVDHPMVAQFKKQINPQNIIQLGDRAITVDRGGNVTSTFAKGLPPEKDPDYIRQTDLTKLLLPKIEEDRDLANLSLRNIKQKSEFLRMLKSDDVQMSTGAYANLELQINKIKAMITNDDELKEKITNTEFATARMGADVFALLKPLGIGARGLDTPAERQFLQKVLTGEIELERETLIKMTEQAIKSNKKVVNDFYNRITSSKGNLYKEYFDQLGEDKEIYNLNIKKKYNLE